jgi:aspartate-semialdehyde dehydrogenase
LKRKVAILGATGVVGQRLIQLLEKHPWFEVEVLAASERSATKKYRTACKWISESEMPTDIGEMTLVNSDTHSVERECDIDMVFSALPGDIAGSVEEGFAKKYPVFSKASAHRLEKDIPLMIPEVNPEHLSLISVQKKRRRWKGFISTDPNCSTIQLAITLKPLMVFKPKKVVVSTMQAVSGAGYPGVASMDIIDNILPYIPDEEEKIESETLKVLGNFDGAEVRPANIAISAGCNRVNVKDGHLQWVFAELGTNPSIREVREAFENFKGEPQKLNLPSAPENPIIVRNEPNRPQPRLDRDAGSGMSVTVGRVRHDRVLTIRYVCLSHNTIRGAAGAALLSAELATKKRYV